MKKFKGFIVTDAEPKIGDIMVCVNKGSINYGLLINPVNDAQTRSGSIDTNNWKVVTNLEERKEAIVDDVIEDIKKQVLEGDVTVLDGLLKLIPEETLIQALSEEVWENYSKIKRK